MCSVSFGQSLNPEKIFKLNYNLFNNFSLDNGYSLIKKDKQTPQNFNDLSDNTTLISPRDSRITTLFFNFPKHKLSHDLRNVMLELPDLNRSLDYDPSRN